MVWLLHYPDKYVSMKNLICLVLFITLLSCSPKLSPSAAPDTENTELSSSMDESILKYVNEHRRSKGLGALQTLDAATQQAYLHSKNMATGKTAFGHDGFEKRVQLIQKSIGADYIPASSENVANGQLSAKEVVKGWLNSPGHKRNIEGNYTLTGIGTYKDRKGRIYFTQIFLRK